MTAIDKYYKNDHSAPVVYETLAVLESLSQYNKWLFSNLQNFISGRVLEVGAGIGNITQFLFGYPEVLALEPHPESINEIEHSLGHHDNVKIIQTTLENYHHNRLHPHHHVQ